ncbi:hypothetical protein CMV_012124 [Castanea mollissima]|uniref:Photolyase/cryptochrome alpha/beta domain-containing protein n=1 Tax=Castanea mollissima TaxID=60419 RepID=A0A8J4RG32_9ROSI|nr:hypothetical protein CMV_012124 [Castanea mollissima]
MGSVKTIVWFRRDLRIEENPALAAAAKDGYVFPVYIWCPKDSALFTILKPKEKDFLENYVTKFQQNIPQLLEVYEGKSDLLDLGIGLERMSEIKPL